MQANLRPNLVDVHVGDRLRTQRVTCGLSRSKLAEQLGVTFQKLKKYESGSVRINAGHLLRASEILQVPISFFFEEYNETTGPGVDILTTRAFLKRTCDYDA